MGMVKMTHVNIYGPQGDPQETLEVLARLACFQPDSETAALREKEQENVYAPLLTATLGLLKDLGEPVELTAYDGGYFDFAKAKQSVERFAAEVAQRGKLRAELTARMTTLEQTKTQLYHLTGLQATMDEIFGVKYLKVRFGRLPKDSYVKLPYYGEHSFTFREYDFDGEYYWGMYFVPEARAKEVDDIFASLYFERVWVPDFVHGTPQDAIAQIMTEESEVRAKQEKLDNMTDIAGPEDIRRLHAIAAWLNYEAQIFNMHKYVILLEHSYYISGFVPQDDLPRVREALAILPGVRVCEDSELEAGTPPAPRKPPVKLRNNWLARPFEMFIEMYGLPEYGDLDPTIFVAVTYSILFGVMFGDVGQGVLLGLIGYFYMYKKLNMKIGLVLTRCSVFSVVFGFVYGSVFGYEHVLDPLYRAFGFAGKPMEVLEPNSIITLLVSSVVAGIFLIVAAMLTGIISCVRRGQTARATFSVNGLAGLVFYISLLLTLVKLALGFDIPFVGTVPFYILCLGVPFVSIYFAEPICKKLTGEEIDESVGEMLMNGFFEIFDALLSFASNTMSFLRVGGFALAHAGMMTMVFTLADMTKGVPYLLIVVIGNLFVMALEGLFVGIQVLRLEFYEMFSRFFDANGAPFEPLRVTLDPARADA